MTEFRIPYMLPGMFIMPAGLFWYGWSAQRKLHWVLVDVGIVIFTLDSVEQSGWSTDTSHVIARS
jgi:hypothetical protein